MTSHLYNLEAKEILIMVNRSFFKKTTYHPLQVLKFIEHHKFHPHQCIIRCSYFIHLLTEHYNQVSSSVWQQCIIRCCFFIHCYSDNVVSFTLTSASFCVLPCHWMFLLHPCCNTEPQQIHPHCKFNPMPLIQCTMNKKQTVLQTYTGVRNKNEGRKKKKKKGTAKSKTWVKHHQTPFQTPFLNIFPLSYTEVDAVSM